MQKILSLSNSYRNFLDSLENKKPLFMLAGSYTKTAEIDGITVAGLPGKIYLTPPLDMEVLYYGKPKTNLDIPKMPEGPPSPVLITSVVKKLIDFPLQFLDLGLRVKPKCPYVSIDTKESDSILEGANVDAEYLFEEGLKYSEHISPLNDTIVISECVPAGTTTAYAVTKALGYQSDNCFSSSHFDSSTYNLKESIVNQALEKNLKNVKSPFDAIHYFGDNMQAFTTGFVKGLSKRNKVILAGGTQMAAVLAILNKIDNNINFDNIGLMTTKWILNDAYGNIAAILKQIQSDINVFFSNFSLEKSKFRNLQLYEAGYVKEGTGCGAAICFAYLNGISEAKIIDEIDNLYSLINS